MLKLYKMLYLVFFQFFSLTLWDDSVLRFACSTVKKPQPSVRIKIK